MYRLSVNTPFSLRSRPVHSPAEQALLFFFWGGGEGDGGLGSRGKHEASAERKSRATGGAPLPSPKKRKKIAPVLQVTSAFVVCLTRGEGVNKN